MMVVLPATHPLGNQTAVHVEHIADEPFIVSTGGCEPLITEVLRAAGATPKTQFTIRDMQTILTMVQEGFGVTIVPELALPSKSPPVCMRPLTPSVHRQIGIVVRSWAQARPAVKDLFDYAQGWAKT
jgi:DNA-binding transcriptional LysR family regulator